MKPSIRLKLISFTICIVLLVGGSISFYSISQGRHRILAHFEDEARVISTLISTSLVDGLYSLDIRSMREHLEISHANRDISYTYVTDRQGVVLTDGTDENPRRDQKLSDAFSVFMLASHGWVSTWDKEILKVGGPILLPGGEHLGYLQVGFSLKSPREVIRVTTRTSLYITVICLVIGSLLAFFLSTSFSRPIWSIAQASRRIGEGKLDTRLPTDRRDELGFLAESVNLMAGALQAREAEAIRARETLKAQYQDLQLLHEISQIVLSSHDFKTVLQDILHKVLVAGSHDLGLIRLADLNTGMLVPVASKGYRDPENVKRHRKETRPGRLRTEAMVSKQPAIVENVPEYQGLSTLKREGVHSAILVPVQAQQKVLGVIQFGSRTPRVFQPHEVSLLEAVGNQMGLVIQKARLFEEVQRQSQKIQALYSVTSTVSHSLDANTIAQAALRATVEALKLDAGCLYIVDQEKTLLRVQARYGIQLDALSGHEVCAPGEGIIGRVFKDGGAVVFSDVANDSQYGSMAGSGMAWDLGFRSAAALPITTKDQVFGVMYLCGREVREFTSHDIELFLAIGVQVGVAIENARLFGETQKNLKRVQVLREIDQAIASSLDLRAVLDIFLEKVTLTLPYSSAATILLVDPGRGELDRIACRNLDEAEWKQRGMVQPRHPLAVLEVTRPLVIRNVQTDPSTADPDFFRRHGLVSLVVLPLVNKDEVVGVLSVYSKEEREFGKEEVEFLNTLAARAAVAIHNARLYEELRASRDESEKANKAKDEFLGFVSHELKTPVHAILGYVGMIEDGIVGEINQEQQQVLRKIIWHAKDLSILINGLLEATRVRSGEVRLELSAVPLGQFLDELRSAYDFPMEKPVSLNWDYPSELPVVSTDSDKLKHILQNLISNAIKFTEKGSVTISARIKEANGGEKNNTHPGSRLPSTEARRCVEFRVNDTGIGIPKESFSYIFEMFGQADGPSRSGRSGGVGLGLYIVDKFTELLGGEVEVQSELGKGSTFTVTIPA
ncbi:MAG: GAF domain-containing protein [Deltaproteobacteria bacterium]|nr:GAF domain-containing protein [Deltaproteobacteria bacterium]